MAGCTCHSVHYISPTNYSLGLGLGSLSVWNTTRRVQRERPAAVARYLWEGPQGCLVKATVSRES